MADASLKQNLTGMTGQGVGPGLCLASQFGPILYIDSQYTGNADIALFAANYVILPSRVAPSIMAKAQCM